MFAFRIPTNNHELTGTIPAVVTCLIIGFCVNHVSCGKDAITDKLLPKVESAFKKMHPVQRGAPIKIECETNLTLINDTFQWYTSDSEPLESVTAVFENTTVDHRTVMVVLNDSDVELYIYCVDPATNNVIKSMKLEQLNYKRFFQTKTSRCALHDDYWTVLTCRDMFIPPSQTDKCVWAYTPFGEQESGINHKTYEVLVLGGGVLEAREGYYMCKCSPTKTQYLLMNFTVYKTEKDDGRELENFHFCRHFLKEDTLSWPTISPSIDGVAEGISSKETCLSSQRAYKGLLAALVIVLVLSIAYIIFTVVRDRRIKRDHQNQQEHEAVSLNNRDS